MPLAESGGPARKMAEVEASGGNSPLVWPMHPEPQTTGNYIEHPELVAQRLLRYTRLVGRERVIAGSDCGFGTFAVMGSVHPDIVFAKLSDLAEGAADHLPVVLVREGPKLLKPAPVIPVGLVATPIEPEHRVATVARVAREAECARCGAVPTR